MAKAGYDPVFGARPLRRFIAHHLETRLGRALLGGEVQEGALVRVDVAEGELAVSYESSPARSQPAA